MYRTAKPIRAGHAPVPQGIRGGGGTQQAPQKIIGDDSLKKKSMKGKFLTFRLFKEQPTNQISSHPDRTWTKLNDTIWRIN